MAILGDILFALTVLMNALAVWFVCASLQEICDSLATIAKYFAGKKTISFDGPVSIKVVKESEL